MIEILYLSGHDVEALALGDDEILDSVSAVLAAQGRGETVLEPRAHLFPLQAAGRGHFNVLRGATGQDAGVKIVGDFVDNHRLGLPSELALLVLMDPVTGVPSAIVDATAITEMRTGAVTALGGRWLARRDARVLGHVGARGTAYWNVRLLARVLPELSQVRVHSRRPESRAAFAARLARELGLEVRAVDTWEQCVRDADVVVEASRLLAPEPLLRTEWITPGSLLVPYGTVSALELDLLDVVDKVVVDDWRQAQVGPLGALRAHVDSGRLSRDRLHAELGEIACGARPGRQSQGETILLWHRGLSTCDIALGRALVDRARGAGLGTTLPYRPRER